MLKYIFLSLCVEAAFALPHQMAVKSGGASCKLSPDVLEVRADDGTILEWDSFSIDPSETVSFQLPGSEACVLNRIVGLSPSEILGALLSNGKVVLVNPNGIVFGPESRIDTESLAASSFDSLGKGGRIQHAGKIKARMVELTGDEVYVFDHAVCEGERISIGDRDQSRFVWVGREARLNADGFEGGEVLVLSKGTTEFFGQISARGELRGGFAEVSGSKLVYEGAADLRGLAPGTLLLDPTNITIGPATANNTETPGFTFPLTCGGVSASSTRNTTTAPAANSTIDVMTLTTQIGLGHIIIDSTAGAGGLGNITWNAGANFAYTSANDLVLRAPATGTVTILSNVQNAGTGRVAIDSLGPSVLINTAANNQAVSFGSLNGLTQICAPNGDVVLQGGNTTINDIAQVGYSAPSGSTASGPIQVACRNLSLFGSTQNGSYANIGHGQYLPAANQLLTTTPTATIDVAASGNIILSGSSFAGGAGTLCVAIIGHGMRSFTPGSLIEGDISVVAGGNLDILTNPRIAPVATGVTCRIGHGTSGFIAGSDFTANANIYVECGGRIRLEYTSSGGAGHNCAIGHTSGVGTMTGDVTVLSGSDILMIGHSGAATVTRSNIGHLSLSPVAINVTGNVRVFACRDISLEPRNNDVFGIGFVNPSAVNSAIGDVEVVAGRDILLAANGSSNAGRIGNNLTGMSTATRTFAAAGRDISLSGTFNAGIGGFGDIFVAAGRNITLAASGTGTTFLGTDDGINAVNPRTTTVFAGGNIVASNPASPARAVIGRGLTPSAAAYTSSLDLRAGGDIQLSFPFSTNVGGVLLPTSGNLFIEADTALPAGALFTANAASVTSICGVTPNLPVLRSPVCPATISSDSPSIESDALGAIRFDTGNYAIPFGLQTTVGSITLHSADTRASAMIQQNLTVGTNANNANILTLSGNIEISGTASPSGCVRADSFYNVTLDTVLLTTGSVFISANNNFVMTSASSIDTSGGNSPVTLIVDNQAPIAPLIGSGLFQMAGGSSIESGTGLLQIYTALQNANLINGSLNGQSFDLGEIFTDTNQEVWCTYYCSPLPGSPFTVSYKNCLQLVLQQAMVVVDEELENLHPYNEFPGWKAEFNLIGEDWDLPYFLRRRHLNAINHPKTWTVFN